jgi:hypothetical protein
MNLRHLSITVAVLVALCAVAWFAQRPAAPTSADPRVGASVLTADLAARAAQVKIADQGKSVELVRQPDGAWRVVSYHDLPADFSKLSRLVGDLTEAKIQRLVTARADRLERLEFKDTTLRLADDTGKELWQITLGKSADGGGRFLRYGAEEKGYLANLSLWLDTEPKNWADSTLVSLKADDIAGIEVGFTDPAVPAVSVSRAKKEEPWTAAHPPEGKRLKTDRVTSLLSSLVSLRFTDTTAPDDPKVAEARAHTRTLKLTTFDGKAWTIALGRKPEEKRPKPAGTHAEEKKSLAPEEPGPAAAADATDTPEAGEPSKPTEPEMETIPAGPVFVSITTTDPAARINALMEKRAFQIGEWTYTGLPSAPADFWEDAPPPAPAAPENKDQAGTPKP